jgi:hypothetical protein
MKKYLYKFCVYKNNLRDGIQFVAAFDSLRYALECKTHLQNTGGGCCDVVKKKIHPQTLKPLKNSIFDNIRYY